MVQLNKLIIPALLCAVHGVSAQQSTSARLDPRFEALNAVFRFRDDLRDSATVIAKCRLFNVGKDSSQAKALDARFRERLVLPATKDSTRVAQCGVGEFAVNNTRVLWLESLVEVKRSPELRPMDEEEFEITFQVLLGPGYREYDRYVVGPTRVASADYSTKPPQYTFTAWRVLEYKFLGGDYDWGTDIGGSAAFRRPPSSVR